MHKALKMTKKVGTTAVEDTGFNDGQDGPFKGGTYGHCGNEANGDEAYYDGFIDGCMSVQGNTRDVCESAD